MDIDWSSIADDDIAAMLELLRERNKMKMSEILDRERRRKMVDFTDITDEDIKAQWGLICERDKQRFDEFVARHPVWKDLPFHPEFETVEAYKQHLYEIVQQYENEALLVFDETHEVMQKLYDNLKAHCLGGNNG